jgi:DNA polymerase-3 subunit gamma/tau
VSYTVLARRYRSRTFDEVIGQDPIARTLARAIERDRTAHAYLFCGTRGVGKTSMARIFARALNVSDDLAEAESIGEAILRGDDIDVIEIDGASNRGVQEARDLIAGAGLSPARCRHKIYIIDEVHMLTREAFNALLKTMEEPPAHVKFILCTTEPQKVPATIQSRCQRFDFRPLPAAKIASHLRMILEQEGTEADDEVIAQVAALGRGSMRDALSVLDRLLAAGDEHLTASLLEQMVGAPDHAVIESLVEAIADGDPAEALRQGAALLDRGATIEQALEAVTEHLRTLMIVAACGEEADLLEISSDALARAASQAARFDAPGLVHMIALCDAVARGARGSATARALFDAAVVRLALAEHLASIPELLEGAGPAGASLRRAAAAGPAASKKKEPGRPAPAPAAHEPVAVSAPPAPAVAVSEPAPIVPEGGDDLWAAVLDYAGRSPIDVARVDHLRFQSFDGTTLRLQIDEAGAPMARFLAAQVEQIRDLIRRATGRRVAVKLDDSGLADRPHQVPEKALTEIQALPEVARAMALFDATVFDVQDRPPAGDAGGGKTAS